MILKVSQIQTGLPLIALPTLLEPSKSWRINTVHGVSMDRGLLFVSNSYPSTKREVGVDVDSVVAGSLTS